MRVLYVAREDELHREDPLCRSRRWPDSVRLVNALGMLDPDLAEAGAD
ncbi:MAG: hypothetical protein GXP62_05695 [Oligoflexia bacterium]|nr:hypothetical protein [Oligoflexia bacterium]